MSDSQPISNVNRNRRNHIELIEAPNAIVEQAVHFVHELPRWNAIALMLPYFLLVTLLEFFWGNEVLLVILYLPVITMMAIRVSLKRAIQFAFVCSFVWLADDIFIASTEGPNSGELFLAIVHCAAFTVIAIVVSRLKIALHNEFLKARYDFLTGLANMQMFYAQAESVLKDPRRTERPFSMIFIDCDNFKTVNDTLGHEEGNRVLKTVADELAAKTRQEDCTARFGGDEFVVLFPETNLHNSQIMLQKLRDGLLQRMSENNWPVTFSIGIVNFSRVPDELQSAVNIADELMYDCKKQSKNGIFVKQVC